jgi:hypothetical protein
MEGRLKRELISLLVTGLMASGATAEEGKLKLRGTLVVVDAKSHDVPGDKDTKPSLTSMDGTVFSDNKKMDGMRYQVIDVFDGKDIDVGYKTFTASDGSQIYATYKVVGGSPPSFKGEWTATGGTGAFKGITGSGQFSITWIADTVAIDDLEGSYKLP